MAVPDTPLFVKTHDFNVWLLNHTQRFPKNLRYSYMQRLEAAAFEFEELLLMANADREPDIAALRKFLSRLARPLREGGCDAINEAPVSGHEPRTAVGAGGTGWATASAQTKTRTSQRVATECGLVLEVGKGGIEPPTPGFSVGMSMGVDAAVTSNTTGSCGDRLEQPETSAQQKAQHEVRELDDLARLISLWPSLPDATVNEILKLAHDAGPA